MANMTFKILIVGGGSGGISLAARLVHAGFKGQIGILEPSEHHYYQPLWTLVGAGIVSKASSQRSESAVIPSGVEWVKDHVKEFRPDANQVQTAESGIIEYEVMIVATGLELNFDKIDGVEGNLGKNGLISVYQYDQLDSATKTIREFIGGVAIFTMPPVPIKCAGAPHMGMYLADDVWRQSGVREKTKIIFASAGAVIFGIKEFAAPLNEVVRRKGIETRFSRKLVGVRAAERIAVFESTNADPSHPAGTREEVHYDLLHVVPPMSAHRFIQESLLASEVEGQKGWLGVDKYSLQHKKYPNVFGIGDVTGIPNSKTGAAIRKQAPIVAGNVVRFLKGEPMDQSYDGYSSCPLITGIGKVILAEFGYDGKLLPSFPLDPTKERRIYWILKKVLLPPMYWHGMLRGHL
jgi:sulfide:quinone oxidoreductase